MTFAAPLWLGGAAALSLLVVALHLLARRRPRPMVYPTARFIPERAASAPAAARRPSDLLLLLLRVAIILLIGAAFARPLRSPPRRTAHLVLVDRSRAASRMLDDSFGALLRQASLVIAFDSTPRPWREAADGGDSIRSSPRGSLSAALLAAVRRAPALAAEGDSLALHVVSPFAVEEWDEATLAIRGLWPGQIVLHVTAPVAPTIPPGGGSGLRRDDPLGATLGLIGQEAQAGALVVRSRPVAADSTWGAAGGALVYWPHEPAEAPWTAVHRDTVGGIFSGGHVVVAPFTRAVRPPEGVVIARWPDGTAAATERPLGAGCERNLAIPTDMSGDVMLRPGMLALARALTAPCGGRREFPRVAGVLLDSLRGPSGLVAADQLARPVSGKVPANGWYLAAALLLLAGEPLVRRGRR
ncbi:MAG: BatA domain-containing protein [Gemmatimonadota bacterium]|nr:BatA domain-containing protein [Gemmatimonadota bacterium]